MLHLMTILSSSTGLTTVFLHIKLNTVRLKVTNGPSVTVDKTRFL